MEKDESSVALGTRGAEARQRQVHGNYNEGRGVGVVLRLLLLLCCFSLGPWSLALVLVAAWLSLCPLFQVQA